MKNLILSVLLLSLAFAGCKKERTTTPAPATTPVPTTGTTTGQQSSAKATVTEISPSTGTLGTVVTVTGTNFGTSTTAVTVFFNGLAGTVQSVTPTEIKVVVPVTTSGNVTLIKGSSTVTGPVFTYVDLDLTAPYVNGDVALKTQADVDAFVALNKGKELQITGSLVIGGSDVTSLSGLSNITAISGKLLLGNTSVIDLSGFSALKSLGSLALFNNAALINLHGLEGLTTLTSPAIVDSLSLNVPVLYRIGGIWIAENRKLTSIAALQNITTASIIDIAGNVGLNDFCPLKGPITNLSTQPAYPYRTFVFTVNSWGGVTATSTIVTQSQPALTLTNNGNYVTTPDALAAVALCK